jgi:hypothetical protein
MGNRSRDRRTLHGARLRSCRWSTRCRGRSFGSVNVRLRRFLLGGGSRGAGALVRLA